MADAVWYVGKGGQQLGPFTVDDVKAKLASGEVAAATSRGRKGWRNRWRSAAWPTCRPAPAGARLRPRRPLRCPPGAAGPNPAARFARLSWPDTMIIVNDPDAGLTAVADKKSLVFPLRVARA